MNDFSKIKARFESGNSVQVDKATVPKSEFDALIECVERLEKDAELLDWLNDNFFRREMSNFDAVIMGREGMQNKWAFFTPINATGDLRDLLRAAIEAEKP